ncbi:MAG TPA: hypothetical protein VFM58_02705 [Solirubrobacteraceae bacterium]|nr:hypothetical protein [Solirubrobacteraceae bacterium]
MADWSAGTLVNPKGMTKKVTASVAGGEIAGVAGNLAANLATGGAYAGAPAVPSFGRVAYVGVNASELALVKTKSGAFKMKVTDEVIASVPRADVTAAELDQGKMLSHLKIGFSNGVTWEFDIPKMAKKTAVELVTELGGRLT